MDDMTMQDTHASSLSGEAATTTRGQMSGRATASELIDHLAAEFSKIDIEETEPSQWFNDPAQPMPSGSVTLPASAPRSAETGQQAEDKFHANLIIVSGLAELPVPQPGAGRLPFQVDENRQLAASVVTLLAAVSASSLSFDSDLQFWAAVGLKMQLKGYERLNPAHEYRQVYKKIRELTVKVYGAIAQDRGRFKEVNFPKKVRTQEQQEERKQKITRRSSSRRERKMELLRKKPEMTESARGAVDGDPRSARLIRRNERRAAMMEEEKYELHEIAEVLEEIGDELRLT